MSKKRVLDTGFGLQFFVTTFNIGTLHQNDTDPETMWSKRWRDVVNILIHSKRVSDFVLVQELMSLGESTNQDFIDKNYPTNHELLKQVCDAQVDHVIGDIIPDPLNPNVSEKFDKPFGYVTAVCDSTSRTDLGLGILYDISKYDLISSFKIPIEETMRIALFAIFQLVNTNIRICIVNVHYPADEEVNKQVANNIILECVKILSQECICIVGGDFNTFMEETRNGRQQIEFLENNGFWELTASLSNLDRIPVNGTFVGFPGDRRRQIADTSIISAATKLDHIYLYMGTKPVIPTECLDRQAFLRSKHVDDKYKFDLSYAFVPLTTREMDIINEGYLFASDHLPIRARIALTNINTWAFGPRYLPMALMLKPKPRPVTNSLISRLFRLSTSQTTESDSEIQVLEQKDSIHFALSKIAPSHQFFHVKWYPAVNKFY